MARNGLGTYARVYGPYVYNTTIDQVQVNAELDDIATALTNSLTKNGETTATANQPMGTYRHTGVGNGVARTDYAAMGQVSDGTVNWIDGGGTADAITATYAPALTALIDGQLCFVRATAANATTTPTFAPNGLTAHTITLNGGQALVAGNIYGDGHELILRYNLAGTIWELLNPNVVDITGNAATATTAVALTNTSGQIPFPATYNPSAAANTLDDYDEYTAASAACSGAITTAGVWRLTKIGNVVTLVLPAISGTASAAAYFLFGTVLPVKYRPTATIAFPIFVIDNAAQATTPGKLQILTNGSIYVYKDASQTNNFTAAASAGLNQESAFSWRL